MTLGKDPGDNLSLVTGSCHHGLSCMEHFFDAILGGGGGGLKNKGNFPPSFLQMRDSRMCVGVAAQCPRTDSHATRGFFRKL
jgi:hypothetical protein